jgi:hypothetical protein
MARLQPEDLLPTEEELRLMREAQAAPGTGQAIGSTLGTLAGGALSLIPGAQPFAPMLMGAGGSLGGLIGGGIGGGMGEEAQQRLSELEQKRQEKITAQQMREEALRRLLEQT